VYTSKAKQGINSLLPIARQVFSHPQESRAPSRVTATWEDKHHHSECSPFLLFAPAFIAEQDVIWYGTSPWSVEVSYPGCVPSQPFVQSQPIHWWGSVRGRKSVSTAQ